MTYAGLKYALEELNGMAIRIIAHAESEECSKLEREYVAENLELLSGKMFDFTLKVKGIT